MGRAVRFVKYDDKGSVAVGADQMAPALRALGVDAATLHAGEMQEARGQILVFIKRADLRDLLRARRADNLLVVDLQDTPVFRPWISHWPLYDAFLFRNRHARRAFWWVGGLRRTIYQHWDPRYGPHRAGHRELRLGYLGTPRSLDLWGRLPGVEMVGPDDWFDRAPLLNAHLSLRHNRREWRFKPNAKVATAAACEAVLLTTPDSSSVELLGEDYPFYVADARRESVLAAVERARRAVGGESWQRAVARLRALRDDLSVERIARQYVDLFAELERRGPRRGRG